MPHDSAPSSGAGRLTLILPGLLVAGVAARLALMLLSIGSNDAVTWLGYAQAIYDSGLAALYQDEPLFNHPPLMGWLAAIELRLSELTGIPFYFWLKLPGLAGELLSIYLIRRIWLERGKPELALPAASFFSACLVSVLLCGYHGNTDSLYAGLLLLSAYLVEQRKRPFLSGLALAAAINVKIIPVLMAPALLARCDGKIARSKFGIGLAFGSLPFCIAWYWVGRSFLQNIFGYNSQLSYWGVQALLLLVAGNVIALRETAENAIAFYDGIGRYLILSGIVFCAMEVRVRRSIDAYEACALSYAVFLVLLPGFGGQYFAALMPLLFAFSIRWGIRVGVLSGLYILVNYLSFMTQWLPLQSVHMREAPPLVVFLSFPIWLTLVVLTVELLRRTLRSGAPAGISRKLRA